jgi:uncharacterized integral membrane protein
MAKSIELRIRNSFGKDDSEKVFRYIEWLRMSISEYLQNVRRLAALLLLLVAAFELVANSENVQLTLGPFHISKGSIILVFVPAVVGYLYLQIMLDTQKISQVNKALDVAFKLWWPAAGENNLIEYLYGPQPAYWTSLIPKPGVSRYRITNLQITSAIAFGIVFLAGVIGFEEQAYYVLFPSRPSGFIAWGISLFVTLFCLVFSVLFFLADTGTMYPAIARVRER